MKVRLDQVDKAFHFVGTNENGNVMHIDTAPGKGGSGQGTAPMETVLMALAGCSAMDVVAILKKSRQDVQSFSVEVDGERPEGRPPTPFKAIHLQFLFTGDVDAARALRAVELSVTKYCSVARMLESTATITYSCSINGMRVQAESAASVQASAE